MRCKLPAALLVGFVVCAWPTANAHEEIFTAVLSGAAESPPNASSGSGFATVTLDLDLFTMRVEVDFTNLQGVTSMAHIHAPTTEPLMGTANVATQVPNFTGFPTNVYSGVYDHTFDLADAATYNPDFIAASGGTVSTASNALIFSLEEGKAYLNIHTSAFPGGEIRGFLVPEPGTVESLVVGTVALLVYWRFRCRRRSTH